MVGPSGSNNYGVGSSGYTGYAKGIQPKNQEIPTPSDKESSQNERIVGLTYAAAKEIFQNQAERTGTEPSLFNIFENRRDNDLVSGNMLTLFIDGADKESKKAMLESMNINQTKTVAETMRRNEMEKLLEEMVPPETTHEQIEQSLNAIYPSVKKLNFTLSPAWVQTSTIKNNNLKTIVRNLFTLGLYSLFQRRQLKESLLRGNVDKAYDALQKTGSINSHLLSDSQVKELIDKGESHSLVFLLIHSKDSSYQEKLLTQIYDSHNGELMETVLEGYLKLHPSSPSYPSALNQVIEKAVEDRNSNLFEFLKEQKLNFENCKTEGGVHLIYKNSSIDSLQFWEETVGIHLPSIDENPK